MNVLHYQQFTLILGLPTYEYPKSHSSLYLLTNIQAAFNWLTLQIRLKDKNKKQKFDVHIWTHALFHVEEIPGKRGTISRVL